jgi:PAS domain S-box-containing protein
MLRNVHKSSSPRKKDRATGHNVQIISCLFLIFAWCNAVHADNALEQWRSKAGETRQLAENDIPAAYAQAQRLQAELPADALPSDRIKALNVLARTEIYMGLTDLTEQHVQQAFELAKQQDDRVGQAEADLIIAMNAVNEARIDKMSAAVMHSMDILDGVDRPDLLGESMLRTSMMYRRMDQVEDSVSVAMQAMEIARRNGNALALAYAYQGLAAAYDLSGHSEEARDYYVRMGEQARITGSGLLETDALLGAGALIVRLGHVDEGLRMIRDAIAKYRTIGGPFYVAHAQYMLANALDANGHPEQALPILSEVADLYRQGANKIGLWWALKKRSITYQALGKIAEAGSDAEQSYQLAQEIGFPLYLHESAKQMASIAAARGEHKHAYRLLAEANEMASKDARNKANRRMVDLAQRYQSESKQREIDTLNRSNQQQASKLERQALRQRWLWTVLVGSVIMLAGASFFLVRLRRSHLRLETLNAEVLQAKNKLQATLDTIPDLLFELGLDGRYHDYHSPRTDLLAAPAEYLLGKTVAEVMPADAAAIIMSALREAHEHGFSTGKQFEFALPHGEFWFELSAASKPVADGEEPRFIVLSRDITERKHLEATALQREQEFRVLVENSPDLIFRYDTDCRRIYTNPAVAKLTGKPSDSLLNMTSSEAKILSADEAEKLMQMIRQVLSTGLPAESEVACQCVDGQLHYFHNRYAPEFNAQGEVVGVISIARDITERKHALAALAAREREFRTLAENLPDNIVRYDREGGLLYINPELEKTLGGTYTDKLGMTVREFFPNGEYDDYALLLDTVLAGGKSGEMEKMVPSPDKSSHTIHNIRMVAEHGDNGEVIGALVIGRDITERKQAERRLWLLDFALNQVGEAVFIINPADLSFMDVNDEACRSLGYSRGELLNLTVYDIDPDAEAESMDDLQREIDASEITIFERRHKTKDGRIFPVEINAKIFDYEGRPTSIALARDITERKRTEHDIALMSQALNKVHEAAYMMDDDARFVYVNDESCRALGYSRDELLAMSVMDIGPGWTVEMVREVWERQREAGTVQAFEASHRRKDGSIFPVEINANQFEYDGNIYGLALVRDITDRKLIENEILALNANLEQRVQERTEELRQQTRYLRTLIDTLPMMAWLKDKDNRFLVANQATALACDHSLEDLVGKTDLDLWPSAFAENYQACDEEVMATRQRKTVEELFFDRRAGNIWVETLKAPVIDEDGSILGTVGVSRDISDRKAMEQARESALAEAERLAQLRSQFMARMSHELRTPLNGIMGYAQILLGENRNNERYSAMLNVIQQSGEYLLNLINEILDFAKIEAGKQELSLSNIQLRRFLRNLAGIIAIKAEQKGLAFVCDIAADVPAGIRADETRLRQVLLNLLSNAVKYSERGQVSLKVTVSGSGRLRFEVQDNGLGIDSEQLETIFHAFEQAGDWQHRTGGTGLGLPISRELVRMMNSDIQVESRVGEGSTFWFDLDVPVVEVSADLIVAEQHIAGYQGLRRRVLVVDDINENRTLLIDILSRLGFETFEAANGKACLDNVEIQKPDLILLDMVMPELDGLETARRLRQLPNLGQTPIIAVSASASDADVTEAMKAGVNVFLSKPIDIKSLITQLAALLKLDWTYTPPETEPAPQHQTDEPLVVPPLQEMAILHRLALEGSMRDIIRQAAHLAELDPRYRPFAAQLRALAQGFQSKAVLDLVERYINRA